MGLRLFFLLCVLASFFCRLGGRNNPLAENGFLGGGTLRGWHRLRRFSRIPANFKANSGLSFTP